MGPAGGDPTALELARALREATAGHVSGILLFGSRLTNTSPDAHSAYDLVVVVDAYTPFYRHLVEAGHHPRSPKLLAWLSRILPPNVIAFAPDLTGDPVAKCIVLNGQHFEQALSSRARDHFLKGRMAQRVGVLWARDRRTRQWLETQVAEGRQDVLRWAGPHLDDSFTPAELARRMLEVSYRGEIRPESSDRVSEVFEAQRDALVGIYGEVLETERGRGRLERARDGRYRLASPPGAGDRLLNRLYFLRSKVRATGRWLKYVVTFSGWLPYIQRKLERRAGHRVELTERERKYPLIFLWPKFFRIVRTLPGAGRDDAFPGDGEDA
jgi:hypothetical protein